MHTKRTTPDQILAAALGQAGLRRTQQTYLRLLLILWLVLPGRHNFTNLARYGPTSDRTYRSWARKPVPWVQLNSRLVLQAQDQQTLHRAQEFLSLHARITNLHHHSRISVTAVTRRNNQNKAFQTWSTVAAGAI